MFSVEGVNLLFALCWWCHDIGHAYAICIRETSHRTHAHLKSFEVHEVVHNALVRLVAIVHVAVASAASTSKGSVSSVDINAGPHRSTRRRCLQFLACGIGSNARWCRPPTFKVPIVASPPETCALVDQISCYRTAFFLCKNGLVTAKYAWSHNSPTLNHRSLVGHGNPTCSCAS